MKKTLIIALTLFVFIGAIPVFALSYVPALPTAVLTTTTSNACVGIGQNLAVGSRGTPVLQLQRFLVSQGYPGAGVWMLTGYFGTATRAALMNFQSLRGLPQTGVLDGVTRDVIFQVSCGGGSYTPTWPVPPTYPVYPTYPMYPVQPVYPVQPMYPVSNLSITDVSGPTSGNIGTNLIYTIKVKNEMNSYASATANWGDYSAATTYSVRPNETQTLTFTHAYQTAGTFTATFTAVNGYGASAYAARSIAVSYAEPHITSVSPSSAYVGGVVTVYGSNFSAWGNTVRFGNGAIGNVSSNGTSITFIVPQYVSPYCAAGMVCPAYVHQVSQGSYSVSIMNAQGQQSNSVTLTVK